MAIDVCCSEIPCSGFSPRISFSYDLNQTDGGDDDRGDIRLDSTLLDSSFEFDFCVGSVNSAQELSPADELFSNGKILPIQIKKNETVSQKPVQIQRSVSLSSSSSSSSSSYCNQKAPEKKRLKELLLMSPDSDLEEGPSSSSSSSRSFLQFKRSLSLNFDRSTRRKGLIKSLRFLSRSNSTGSAPNPKSNLHPKETQQPHKQQNQLKKPSALRRSTSLSTRGSHSSYHHSSSSTQKPQPRKSFGAYNGNGGVRVSPVLNFPPPSFMSNVTVGFFGFGSFLCYGKMKRKTR